MKVEFITLTEGPIYAINEVEVNPYQIVTMHCSMTYDAIGSSLKLSNRKNLMVRETPKEIKSKIANLNQLQQA